MFAHCSAEAVESAERETEGSTTRAMLVDNNTATYNMKSQLNAWWIVQENVKLTGVLTAESLGPHERHLGL
jgi:hypothetical protein